MYYFPRIVFVLFFFSSFIVSFVGDDSFENARKGVSFLELLSWQMSGARDRENEKKKEIENMFKVLLAFF